MNKKRFFLYTDYKQHLDRLSLEEKGMLLDAIFAHAEGEEVDLDGVVGMAFSFISAQMDRDNDNYEKTCEAHREAGSKGGAPKGNSNAKKQPKTTKNNQKQPNSTKTTKSKDIDKDIDIDIDKDIDIDTDKDTDIDKDKGIDKGNMYQQVADMYNDICISFPRVTSLSDARKKAIKARLNKYSLADIQKAFCLAEESDFLKGSNDRNWQANFDWLIKDANMAKVLDGNYQNRARVINKPDNEFFRRMMNGG